MRQVEEPPDVRGCASCMSPLVWLYSFRTGRTFSVVATGPDSFKVHPCRHSQDYETWRSLHERTPDVERAHRGADLCREVLEAAKENT